MVRNNKVELFDAIARPIIALGNEFKNGHTIPPLSPPCSNAASDSLRATISNKTAELIPPTPIYDNQTASASPA